MTTTMVRKVVKGSPEYTVVQDGAEIARAHCVQVQAARFTLVINGRWSGIGTETQVVSALEKIVAEA